MELNPDNGMRAIVKYWAPEYRERFGSHDFMLMSIHTNYSYLQLSTTGFTRTNNCYENQVASNSSPRFLILVK